MITVGLPSFINTMPIIYGLERTKGYGSDFIVVRDVPCRLGRMLRRGEIDLGLISTGILTEEFVLTPGISISGPGRMKSVILCSNRKMNDTSRWKVRLSDESFTANLLTRVICRQRYKNGAVFVRQGKCNARILIGDSALRELKLGRWRFIIDLAKEWYTWTGLPMVFAVLAARKRSPQVVEAARVVCQARDTGLEHIRDVASESAHEFMSVDETESYLKSIDYSLTDSHTRSIDLFLACVRKMGYTDRKLSGRWLW